jgi:preprotein translocase SecE subunit
MIWLIILVVAGVLLFGMYWIYNRPGFSKLLARVEDSGWFSSNAFKYNQGQKVRRATLIALLVLVVAGIGAAWTGNNFGKGNWEIPVAGTDLMLVALFNVQYMFPALVFLGLIWFAWRLVNVPSFADFLIATEAEMNKVSWTTRKRLIQDTIVVLVTVFLLTMYLFVVDILWIRILQIPGVLQINPQEAREKQRVLSDW